MSGPSPDPGSFRDPTSRVLLDGDRVLRVLDAEADGDIEALEATQFFGRAIADGRIVGTRRCDDVPDLGAADRWAACLEHDRIPFLSFPYEWTFSMLQDAALLQLDLLADALDEGLITKDASAYNVQFLGSTPTFIDVGSFERQRPGEPWYGYRQFCQHFLYPLMLEAYRDVPFQPWLRGSIDGITPTECRSALSRRDYLHRGVLTNVWLHARAEGALADTRRDVKDDLRKAGFRTELIKANVRKLAKLVRRLRWKRGASTWSAYGERAHYTDADLGAKEAFVREALADRQRGLVWDLGANDGRFSRIAAETADCVVAADADPLVVDMLYRDLRESGERRILPLLMDLADPSPARGWRSVERPGFLDRGPADAVLALALVHHLAITDNVPLDEVVAFFAQVTGEVLVVEFPTVDDPMVQRLLAAKREGLHADYRLEVFEELLEARFEVVRRQPLAEGTRTLFQACPCRA